MKKLGIIAIAAVLCMGLALPAMAEVTVGGLISFDIWRYSTDDPTGATNGDDSTQMGIVSPINYMTATYTNKDKTLGGFFTIFYGKINDDSRERSGRQGITSDMAGSARFWWQFNPQLQIQGGSIYQIVGGDITPPTGLTGAGVIVLITYGNLHNTPINGIRADYKINDMVSLRVGLYDPDDDNSGDLAIGTGEELSIPRIDFGLPINYKVAGTSIFINPKGSYLQKTYDQAAAGSDDSFSVTVMSIEGSVKFGPVTGDFEFTTATNLGGGDNYVSGILGPSYTFPTITDSETTMYWAGITYRVNPKLSASGFYGNNDVERGTMKLTGRSSYGVRAVYNVTPNFLLRPHIQIFQGADTEVGGVTIAQGAKTTQFGLQFFLFY